MPVAVNSPGAYKSPLESIMEGLNVAANIYNIKDARTQHDLLAKKQQKEEDMDLPASAEEIAALKIPNINTAGFTKRQVADAQKVQLEEGIRAYLKPPKEADPLQDLQRRKLEAEIGKIGAETKRTSAEKAGKLLPATEVQGIGGADSAIQALNNAKDVIKANSSIVGPAAGPLARVMGRFEIGETGKKAKEIEAQLQINAQVLGKYLEGGKLAQNDIARYRQMLPNSSDSADAVERKTILIENLIRQKQQADLRAYGQAGYDISGFQSQQMSAPQQKNQAFFSGKDLNSMSDAELSALHKSIVGNSKIGANK